MTEYEKGVRDTLVRVNSEFACISNGNRPYLTIEKLQEPIVSDKSISKLLLVLQEAFEKEIRGSYERD